jgi:hypothetical protein
MVASLDGLPDVGGAKVPQHFQSEVAK